MAGRIALRWAFLVLAMLALAVQVAASAIVPWRAFDSAADDGFIAASICHASGAPASDHGAPAHRDSRDCALCPFCRLMAQAAVPPAPPAFVSIPVAPRAGRAAMPPPPRAPPFRAVAFAFPRGPPISVRDTKRPPRSW